MYLVELVYGQERPVRRRLLGSAIDRPRAVRFRNAERRAHRDVHKGLANVAIRKVGQS